MSQELRVSSVETREAPGRRRFAMVVDTRRCIGCMACQVACKAEYDTPLGVNRTWVPYKVVGGVRFYERREIKDALAYMRLVLNPHDDVSLRRVINTPARGIGKAVVDAVEGFAAAAASRPSP